MFLEPALHQTWWLCHPQKIRGLLCEFETQPLWLNCRNTLLVTENANILWGESHYNLQELRNQNVHRERESSFLWSRWPTKYPRGGGAEVRWWQLWSEKWRLATIHKEIPISLPSHDCLLPLVTIITTFASKSLPTAPGHFTVSPNFLVNAVSLTNSPHHCLFSQPLMPCCHLQHVHILSNFATSCITITSPYQSCLVTDAA